MTERSDETARSNEVVEVMSAEPISQAAVSEVAEAVPGVVVARREDERSAEPQSPQGTSTPDLHKNGRLCEVLECMLFVSTEPLSAARLAESLQVEVNEVERAMSELEARLDSGSGLQLMRVAGGYQLCTRPEFADYCSIILQPARKKLSKAALETLAIIAYRQPCTQPEVEAVRGVCVDGVIKTLIDRGLIREAGRKHTPGRPILYATTPEFLEYFGLNDISELPDIDEMALDKIRALEAQRELFRSPDGGEQGTSGSGEENTGSEASNGPGAEQ
ncbi:MAG: SMC-Scp complex subunit ScpB [Armatimonadota bacterium]